MSVASAERTDGPAPPPTISVEPALGRPPRMMLGSERPMASLIILVSRAPDVPTRVPGDQQDQVLAGRTRRPPRPARSAS